MIEPGVATAFTDGITHINLDESSTLDGEQQIATFKSASASIYDLSASMTVKGELWNWGHHNPEHLAEIEARLPGFSTYGTDTFSEQSYYLALRDIPKGLEGCAGKAILEVGCGVGEGLNFLSRLVPDARMTGLDLAPKAVARANATLARGDELRFVQGDAEALPFEDASVDVLINVESSHAYPNLKGFLQEAARVLRPGGVLSHIDVYTTQRLRAMRAIQAELPGLEWISDNDISDQVRAAVRQRMAPGSRFRRNLDKQRMNRFVRMLATNNLVMTFGGPFAGYREPAVVKLLNRLKVLPPAGSLPMRSYRHQVAVRS
ncbi:class I SAM-dependent methyltransferase [Actinoplanes sp. N902-109]|uniref:class I SAM-dependent methyltransferase n=1 Tax=Actinoplanes sp. (strain N902-109) TaxID=649831 RepID=UPI00032966AA|nr:class I SAM-dependent methyltransferase [Actinoplanes sp. N902-109]AGL12183.1 methyltransferase [Actinoplanes sp. N902-109]AGL16466.1 methyltransferase [Actinoplanes sp. N902-109]